MQKILIIFFFLLFLNCLQAKHDSNLSEPTKYNKNQFECVHNQLEVPLIERNEQQQREFEAQKSRRKLGISNPQPIRITFDYSNLDSLSGSKAPLGAFIKQQLEVAKKFFEDNLKIDRVSGNNIFAAPYDYCQTDAAVPAADKSTGIADSDLHVYVITEENSGASYLANAGSCYYYPATRPTFGRIKYNLYHLDENYLENDAFEDQLETTIHEITHILGFSGGMMKQFINPATGNSFDADGINPYVTQTIRGISTNVLTTNNVVQTAKDHFGCNTLTGMQLENNGGSGSLGSHWEKSMLFDEFMNPQAVSTKSLYTKFTFALLEDSGWYLPDYTNVEQSLWGYQKGCAFIQGSCDISYSEFIDSSVLKACNHDQSGFGPPSVSAYTQEGGGAEQCYYAQTYTNRYCLNATLATDNPPFYYWGYYFGENSRCTYSEIIATGDGYAWDPSYADYRCHQFVCDASNNVFVVFEGEQYACVEGGSCTVTIQGSNTRFSGSVQAPDDFNYFCMFVNLCPNDCSQNGYCMKGVCHCLPGYIGNDCGTFDAGSIVCTSPCDTCGPTSTNCQSCISGYYLGSNTCKVCSDWITNCNTCSDYQTCTACDSGYYVNGSNTCTLCTSPCDECSGSATTCTSCVAGYLYGSSQCKTCSNWISNCNTCSDYQTCTACDSGYFVNGSNACTQCTSPCDECSGSATTCTSCVAGYLYGSSQCKTCSNWISNCNNCSDYQTCTSCDSGYFVNGSNTCTQCTSPCDECSGTALTCTSCVAGYLYGSSQCKVCSDWISNCNSCSDYQTCTACDSGYFVNGSNTCTQCTSPCDECSGSATTCISCVAGYLYGSSQCKTCSNWISNCNTCSDYQTCTSCDSGYFVNGSNTCTQCTSPCDECSGSATTCTSCVTGYLYGSSQCKTCSDWITNCSSCSDYQTCTSCDNGYYIDGSNTCSQCTSPCDQCSGTANTCTSCVSGYLYGNNQCKVCSDWISNCNSCSDYQTCTSCDSGFYVDGSNNCSSCSAPCVECSGTSTNCISCGGGQIYGNNSCKVCSDWIPDCNTCSDYQTCTSCNSGFYINGSNSCSQCTSPCDQCSVNGTTCTTCVAGYIYGNNQCKVCSDWIANCNTCSDYQTCTACDSGYFVNGSNTCTQCTSPCDECSGTATTCSTCVAGYIYGNNQCKICQDWISNCSTCSDYQTCTSCDNGYYLNASNTCSQCTSPCDECSGTDTTCTSCVTGYVYYNSQCQVCSDWITNCSTCSDYQTCTLCDSGFYVDGSNSCSSCAAPCVECSGTATNCISCSGGQLYGNNQCKICSDWISNCNTCSDYQTCTACDSGFYVDGSNNCSSCTSPCDECSGTDTTCTSCVSGYLYGSSQCKVCSDWISDCNTCSDYQTCTACDSGYFVNGSNRCSSCTSPCDQCSIDDTTCTTCVAGYIYGNNQCKVCSDWIPDCNTCSDYQTCTSCNSGFYINGSNTCSSCTSPCDQCSINDTTCTTCVAGYIYGNNQCKVCSDWISNCNTCSDYQTCTACDSGYFLNGSNTCTQCTSPCDECSGTDTTCTSCITGYVFYNSQCQICSNWMSNCNACSDYQTCTSCDSGFYVDGSNNCSSCTSPCDECSGTDTACTSCVTGYLYGSSQCKTCQNWISDCNTCSDYQTCTACDSGYFVNGSNTCTQCTSPCNECSGSSTTCTSCVSGYLYGVNQCKVCSDWITGCNNCSDYQTCISCDSGYYLNSSNTCSLCTSPCDECSSNDTTCTSCVVGYLYGNNQCKICQDWIVGCNSCSDYQTCTSCDNGYYLNASNTCSQCTSPCDECSGTDTTCTSCVTGYVYYNSQCQVCSDWISNCSTCSDYQTCTLCDSGFYVDGSNSCSSCAAPCVECSGTATNCISCSGGQLYGNNQCKICSDWISNCNTCSDYQTCTACDSGFYVDGSNNCSSCTSPCDECSGTDTTCTSCVSGYLYGSSQCKVCSDWISDCNTCSDYQTCSQCNNGYFVDGSNSCSQCSSPCDECLGTSSTCTSCISGYLYGNNQCKVCADWITNCNTCSDFQTCTLCDTQYYIDINNECSSCNSPCDECSGNADSCVTCIAGYLLGNNQCKVCSDWITGCNTCTDYQTCIACDAGYYLDGGICKTCQHPCTECNSLTDCTVCVAGSNRENAASDCVCSSGFYEDSSQNCVTCEYPCDTCQSDGTTCISCLDSALRQGAPSCACNSGSYDNGSTCANNSNCMNINVQIDYNSLDEMKFAFQGNSDWNSDKLVGIFKNNFNSQLCTALFKPSFLQLLGQNPLCKLGATGTNQEVIVQLSYLTTFDPASYQIQLNDEVLYIDGCEIVQIPVDNVITTAGNYNTYTNAAVPTININGVQSIQTCELIQFTIDSYENDGKQGLQNIVWSFTAVSNSDSAHLTAVNSVLSSSGNSGYQINLDPADFQAGVTYSTQITFENFLGTSGTYNFDFTVTNLSQIAIIQITQDTEFMLNQDNVVEFQLDYKACSPIIDYVSLISYTYTLNVLDSGSNIVENLTGTVNKASFILEYIPFFKSIGETMTIQLTVDNGGQISSVNQNYKFKMSNYILRIQNGNKELSNDEDSLWLLAQAFNNDVKPVVQLTDLNFSSITWSCVDYESGNQCEDKNGNAVIISSGSLSRTIDISNFNRGKSYYFIISTTYNAVVKTQKVLIHLKQSKISQINEISNIYISEYVYKRQVQLKDKIDIDVIFSSLPKKYEYITYKLSLLYNSSILLTKQYYYPSFSFSLQDIIDNLANLISDNNLEIKVEITNTSNDRYYTTSFFIEINLPPVQGTLNSSSAIGTSLTTLFQFSPSGFYDDDKPLKYRYLYYPDKDNENLYYLLNSFNSKKQLLTYLPYSKTKSKITIQVMDSKGNVQSASTEVTVDKGSSLKTQIQNIFNDAQDKNYNQQLTLKTIIALEMNQNEDIKFSDFENITVEIYQTALSSLLSYQSYEIDQILGQLLQILLSQDIICNQLSISNIFDLFAAVNTIVSEYKAGLYFENVNTYTRNNALRKRFFSTQKNYEFKIILQNLTRILGSFMSCSSNYEQYQSRRMLELADDLESDNYTELTNILNSLSSLYTSSTLPNQDFMKYQGSYYTVYSQRLTLKRLKNFFISVVEDAFLVSEVDKVLLSYDNNIDDGFVSDVDYNDNFAVTYTKIYDNIYKNDGVFPYPEQSITVADLDIRLIDDSDNSVADKDVSLNDGVKTKIEFDFIKGFDNDDKYVCIQQVDSEWVAGCETKIDGNTVICECSNLQTTTVVYDEKGLFQEEQGRRWINFLALLILGSQLLFSMIGFIIDLKQKTINNKIIPNNNKEFELERSIDNCNYDQSALPIKQGISYNTKINDTEFALNNNNRHNKGKLPKIPNENKKKNRPIRDLDDLQNENQNQSNTISQNEDYAQDIVNSINALNKQREIQKQKKIQEQKLKNNNGKNNANRRNSYIEQENNRQNSSPIIQNIGIIQGFQIFHLFFQLFWVYDPNCRRVFRIQYYFTRIIISIFISSMIAEKSFGLILGVISAVLLVLNIYSRIMQELSGKNKCFLIVVLLLNSALWFLSLVISYKNEKDLLISDSNQWTLACSMGLVLDFVLFSSIFAILGDILIKLTKKRGLYTYATKLKFQQATQVKE